MKREENDYYGARCAAALIFCVGGGIVTGSLTYVLFVFLLLPVLFLVWLILKEIWDF